MIEKVLNKLGLYTTRQMREIKLYVDAVEVRIEKYISLCESLKKENEDLRLKIAKVTKPIKRRKNKK